MSAARNKDDALSNRSLPAMEQVVADTTRALLQVPPKLANDQKLLSNELDRLQQEGGRHTFRALADGRAELQKLDNEIEKYVSGEKSAEYRREADMYLRRMRSIKADSAATGVVRDSILCHSEVQTHQRYRRRSDLQRVIRMARRTGIVAEEQRHSIIDEFLSDFHGQAPPVYLSQGDTCPCCDSYVSCMNTFYLLWTMVEMTMMFIYYRTMVIRNSLLECTTCGTSAVVRDSTSSCVGFKYVCFSIHLFLCIFFYVHPKSLLLSPRPLATTWSTRRLLT